MRSTNLRGCIIQGFGLFTMVQIILTIAIAIYSYHLGEDSSLARVVQSEIIIWEFSDTDEIPATLPASLLDYPVGVHELASTDDPNLSSKELHAFVFQDDDTTRLRVLQLDEQSDFGSLAKTYVLFAVLAIALLLGFGGWVGHTIAHRLSKPMEILAAKLQNPDAMDGTQEYSNTQQTDEIALVATALDDAISRVKEIREREVTLSRNISHELRTPLTVIRTALDTGNNNSFPPSQNKLESARRASDEMDLLTSACLELARDSKHYGAYASTNIVATVKQIIRESLQLLDAKKVQLDLKFVQQVIEFPVSEALVRLVVGNAIRNGFIHCSDGDIQIELNATHMTINNLTEINDFTVKDVGADNPDSQNAAKQSSGFGLSIMGQACKQLSWTYNINRIPSHNHQCNRVEVTIRFANS